MVEIMSRRGRHRSHRNHNHHSLTSISREQAQLLAADSPVLNLFKAASLKLNDRQDRHERLVKLSRDITIESKRIIFLLHSAVLPEAKAKAVQEANERLKKLIDNPIKSIGLELENSPAYLHSRAVTAGFQEFIEARTLCSVMERNEIITWPAVQNELKYTVIDETEGGVAEKTVVTMLPQVDYMLGLADLTGELMRRAINSISSGDSEECFQSCQIVRDLYTGSIGLYGVGRELSRKLSTTRSNASKVEGAVYAVRVRGGEAPPTLLLASAPPNDWDAQHGHSDDEGFF